MALIHRRHLVKLEREVDVFITRELAAALASQQGFDRYQTSDIETAVSELVTNVLKYGERGWASLRVDRTGFEAIVSDDGPGFGAAPKSGSGLGVGLAGVKRLMDSIEIKSLVRGSRVAVRKNLHGADVTDDPYRWAIDIVGRTRSGRSTSGDSYWVRDAGDSLQVAITDGLGAGQGAAQASATVIESLEASEPGAPLDETMAYAHRRAGSTRGAVCLLARIDLASRTVEYTGVGDVAGFVDPAGEHLALSPGILGVDDPEFRLHSVPWSEHSRLILWTDGIRIPAEELSETEAAMPAADWAEKITLNYGVDRDDGLILLAHEATRT